MYNISSLSTSVSEVQLVGHKTGILMILMNTFIKCLDQFTLLSSCVRVPVAGHACQRMVSPTFFI